jgi:uroporphyrinogen-III synthase
MAVLSCARCGRKRRVDVGEATAYALSRYGGSPKWTCERCLSPSARQAVKMRVFGVVM